MEHNTEEIEIDLVEIFRILKKNMLLIIFAAAFMGLLAGLVSKYVMQEQYESTAKMYIAKASGSNISVSNILSGVSSNDYTELASVRPLIEAVITRLELDETYETLMQKVDIEMPASYILKITVLYEDPKMAMCIANEMAEVIRQGIAEVVGIDEPQIVEVGIIPDKPISPNVLKNILLGVLLGSLGAMAILAVYSIMMEYQKDKKRQEEADIG